MIKWYSSLVICLVLAGPAFAAPQDSSFAPPDKPNGACVKAYFDAYTAGTEAMREFSLNYVADESLNRRPMNERLEMYNQMKQQMGSIRPDHVIKSDSASTAVLVEGTEDRWFTFTFMFEPVPEHKLLGIRIDMTDPTIADQPTTPMTQQEYIDSLSNRLTEMANVDSFSGVVLVARNDIIIFEKAYGLASKEFKVPNALDTKFNLGSINKVFTKIAIGQLVQQGKLKFTDTLGKYLPDYPDINARSQVMVRHLLEMSSGIGDFFGEKFDQTPKDKFRTNNDFLPMFDSIPLAFQPGTKREYSNGGYIVLGAIIEKVSGQPYYDYVRQNIYLPSEMKNTDWYAADDPVENLAEGYSHPNDSSDLYVNNIYTRPARGSAAGGGYSTVEDLLKFTISLHNNQLLSPEYTDWFFSGIPPADSSQTGPGPQMPRSVGFAGGAPGINADIEADFDAGTTVIVLGNYDPPNASRVANLARQWLERVSE